MHATTGHGIFQRGWAAAVPYPQGCNCKAHHQALDLMGFEGNELPVPFMDLT